MKKNRLLTFAKWSNSNLGSTIIFCLFLVVITSIIYSNFNLDSNDYPEDDYQKLYEAIKSCLDFENKQIIIGASKDGITVQANSTSYGNFIITAEMLHGIGVSIDVTTTLSSDFELISQNRNYNCMEDIIRELLMVSIILSCGITILMFFMINFPLYCYMKKHEKKNYLPYNL